MSQTRPPAVAPHTLANEDSLLVERAEQAGRLMTYAYDEISRLTGVQMTGTPAVSSTS